MIVAFTCHGGELIFFQSARLKDSLGMLSGGEHQKSVGALKKNRSYIFLADEKKATYIVTSY